MTYMKASEAVAAFSVIMFALMPPAVAQTWQSIGKTEGNTVVTANAACNSSKDTIGVTADRSTILTCHANVWKVVASVGAAVSPSPCTSANFKVGYWPSGYGSTTTYGALSNGPYAITLNSPKSISADTVDRGIAFDFGTTRTSASITTTQNGSPYFSVLTSLDGSSWSTYLPYQNTGTTSYTANISGVSFRYIAITSGHSGYNFTSTVLNSCS